MPAEQNFWDGLFGAKPGPSDGVRVEMRLLKKHGRPLLLLPCHPRAAVATLSLYPAQTPRARAARALLSGLLRFSAPYGTEPGPSDGVRVEMRLLKKHGRPLLLLPCHPRAAVATLSLYPAQTPRGWQGSN